MRQKAMRRFIYGVDSFPDFPPYVQRHGRRSAGDFEPMRRTSGRKPGAKRMSKAKTLRSHRTGR
jgi:hypothetical protein